MSRESIKVVCRIRPENRIETEGNYPRCVTYTDEAISVSVSRQLIANSAHPIKKELKVAVRTIFNLITSAVQKHLKKTYLKKLRSLSSRESFKVLMELFSHMDRQGLERLSQWKDQTFMTYR